MAKGKITLQNVLDLIPSWVTVELHYAETADGYFLPLEDWRELPENFRKGTVATIDVPHGDSKETLRVWVKLYEE